MLKFIFPAITMLIISAQTHSQTVGYMGRRLILEAGYVPLNGVGTELIDYGDGGIPLIHNYKAEAEFIITRYGGVYIRYNPFATISELEYFEEFEFTSGQPVGGGTVNLVHDGKMFSAGYRGYFGISTGILAPMGAFYGVHITYYTFNAAFENDPLQFDNYEVTDKAIGIYGSMGARGIFLNRFTINAMFDFGWFLGEPTQNDDHDYTLVNGYYFYQDPAMKPVDDAKRYFVISPSINLGILLF